VGYNEPIVQAGPKLPKQGWNMFEERLSPTVGGISFSLFICFGGILFPRESFSGLPTVKDPLPNSKGVKTFSNTLSSPYLIRNKKTGWHISSFARTNLNFLSELSGIHTQKN
jgi:hypothetical protein